MSRFSYPDNFTQGSHNDNNWPTIAPQQSSYNNNTFALQSNSNYDDNSGIRGWPTFAPTLVVRIVIQNDNQNHSDCHDSCHNVKVGVIVSVSVCVFLLIAYMWAPHVRSLMNP